MDTNSTLNLTPASTVPKQRTLAVGTDNAINSAQNNAGIENSSSNLNSEQAIADLNSNDEFTAGKTTATENFANSDTTISDGSATPDSFEVSATGNQTQTQEESNNSGDTYFSQQNNAPSPRKKSHALPISLAALATTGLALTAWAVFKTKEPARNAAQHLAENTEHLISDTTSNAAQSNNITGLFDRIPNSVEEYHYYHSRSRRPRHENIRVHPFLPWGGHLNRHEELFGPISGIGGALNPSQSRDLHRALRQAGLPSDTNSPTFINDLVTHIQNDAAGVSPTDYLNYLTRSSRSTGGTPAGLGIHRQYARRLMAFAGITPP